MYEEFYNWLKGYPGLELLQKQQVDTVPGGCGLFYRGLTIGDRSTNMLGDIFCQKTQSFRLVRYGQPEESAVFFLMLGSWVAGANAFADDHTVELENARCVRDHGGLVLWEADLHVRYREEL